LALDGRKKSGRQEVFLAEKWEKRQKKKAKKNPKTEKLKTEKKANGRAKCFPEPRPICTFGVALPG